jgi:hypothetical protein
VHLRRALLDGGLGVDHGVAFGILDNDRFGAVGRGGNRLADHHGDSLADVRDALVRQRRPHRHDQLGAAAAWQRRVLRQVAMKILQVGAGQHGDHALHRLGLASVDRRDVGGGVRAAHEHGVGLARQRGVRHEAAQSPQQLVVFNAGHALGGGLGVHVG